MKLEISDFDLEKEVKEEIQCMQMYFPPKNQSDINHYKQEALKVFQEFENERKIPKKFLVGKSAIEFSNAQNSIQVLYFLSEFALRNQFMNNFPRYNLKVLNLNRNKKQERQTDFQNFNISEIYNEFSSNKSSQLSNEEIKQSCENLYANIILENEKQKKIFGKQVQYQNEVQEKAEQLTKKFQQARQLNVQLNQEFESIKNEVPQEYFQESRGLDRKQLIDKNQQTFQELNEIKQMFEDLDINQKMSNFDVDTSENLQINTITKQDFIDKMDSNMENKVVKQKNEVENKENCLQHNNNSNILSLSKLFSDFNQKLKIEEKILSKQQYKQSVELDEALNNKIRDALTQIKQNNMQVQQLKQKTQQIFDKK